MHLRGVKCFNIATFLVKAETITGFKTQLTEQPCGNAQLSIFSFVSLKIKGGVAVQT